MVRICATLVNIQRHRQHFDQLIWTAELKWQFSVTIKRTNRLRTDRIPFNRSKAGHGLPAAKVIPPLPDDSLREDSTSWSLCLYDSSLRCSCATTAVDFWFRRSNAALTRWACARSIGEMLDDRRRYSFTLTVTQTYFGIVDNWIHRDTHNHSDGNHISYISVSTNNSPVVMLTGILSLQTYVDLVFSGSAWVSQQYLKHIQETPW